jgi:hypothetical protein
MPEYIGPSSQVEIIDFDSLKKSLNWLSSQNFIPSFMEGPQSVGITLRKVLKIDSNNLRFEDGVSFSIKCSRKKSKSKITGFTKSPIWLSDWNAKRLLIEYGYKNKNSGNALMIELKLVPNNQGLFLEFTNEGLFLCNPKGPFAMYGIDTIRNSLNKLSNTIRIDVLSKIVADKEYFHYNQARLIKLKHAISSDDIKSLFTNRDLTLEIRMYLKESGSVRDHGFAFRFSSKLGERLYVSESIVSSKLL